MLADDGKPLLSDFGRSKIINQRGFTTTTITGSLRFLAPELMKADAEPANSDEPDGFMQILSKEADVYAFSMVGVEVSLFQMT